MDMFHRFFCLHTCFDELTRSGWRSFLLLIMTFGIFMTMHYRCVDEVSNSEGAGCSQTADAPTEPGLWNNRAFEVCRQNAGVGKEKAFNKRLEKLAQV